MSDVMHLLGCGLQEALWAIDHQPQMLTALADYRAAQAAIGAMNHPDKAAGFQQLSDSPVLQRILSLMVRAQNGRELDAPMRDREALGYASAHRTASEEEG